jgi:hypothetical protein
MNYKCNTVHSNLEWSTNGQLSIFSGKKHKTDKQIAYLLNINMNIKLTKDFNINYRLLANLLIIKFFINFILIFLINKIWKTENCCSNLIFKFKNINSNGRNQIYKSRFA